jgi:hypothetical protein
MGITPQDEIDAIRQEANGALRVLATYDREGYDPIYVRGDVEPKVKTVAEEIHDELVIQGMGREYLEQLFEAGELHCSMHRFDEITTFHFLDERFTGLFASIDSGADIRLATFADRCRELL